MIIAIVEGIGEPWARLFLNQIEAEKEVLKFVERLYDGRYDVAYYDDYTFVPPEFQGLL